MFVTNRLKRFENSKGFVSLVLMGKVFEIGFKMENPEGEWVIERFETLAEANELFEQFEQELKSS